MKKTTFRNSIIFTCVIFFTTLFMSVGFSAISKDLSISSNASALQMGILVNNGLSNRSQGGDFTIINKFLGCSSIPATNIKKIYFRRSIPSTYVAGGTGYVSCDVSASQNGSVMAYYEPDGTVSVISNTGIIFTNSYTIFPNMDHCYFINFNGLINTSHSTSMYGMFYNLCNSCNPAASSVSPRPTLNLSAFDTSNVTDMGFMFNNMRRFEQIDLSSFDTSNNQYMDGMFGYAIQLTSLDLSNFDTHNVINISSVFENTLLLDNIYITTSSTGWNLSSLNVTGGGGAEVFEDSNVVSSSGCPVEAGSHSSNTYKYAYSGYKMLDGVNTKGCLTEKTN